MKNLVVIIKHLLAVLKFPRRITAFIEYARTIYDDMHGNALYAGSAAKLATLLANTDTLQAVQSGTKTRPATHSAAERNVAMDVVKDNLRALQGDVQDLADADKTNARVIIEGAGMQVKKTSTREKQKNSATNGPLSGQVDLIGEGPGPHEWRMSTDTVNWTYLPATKVAKTRVSNLPVGVIHYFQNRQIMPPGELSDWCQPVSIRVI